MKIHDMDVEQAILNLEVHVGTLLKTLAFMHEQNEKIIFPTRADVEKFKNQTLNEVKQQYPNNNFSRF